jgi:hypothetical protein
MILPMLLLLAQTSHTPAPLTGAPQKGTTKNTNQPKNQQTVSEKDYSADLRAITEELRAIREEQTQAEQARTQHKQYWWKNENPPTWSNWVLAIVAGIAGWVAYRAFTHERDAIRLKERADLLIDSVNLVPRTNPSVLTLDTSIRFQFRNFGPTRASDVHFEKIRVEIEGTQPNYPSDAPPLPRGVVGAGDTIDASYPTLGQVFDAAAILRASRGDAKLTFAIRVGYTDVFGLRHHTTSGGTYYGPVSGFVIEGDSRAD